jgi:hypothetical protein
MLCPVNNVASGCRPLSRATSRRLLVNLRAAIIAEKFVCVTNDQMRRVIQSLNLPADVVVVRVQRVPVEAEQPPSDQASRH